MESDRYESLNACCLRAVDLIDSLEAFYKKELANASRGTFTQLAALQKERDKSEKNIHELTALLGLIRKNGKELQLESAAAHNTAGRIAKLEKRLEALFPLAEASFETSSRLKDCVLEAFNSLRTMKKAYIADKDGKSKKGVLIDKEG